MALEPGVVYIDDLVAANPVGTDTIDEGDDHIRNIKTAVKGSFPNLGAAAVTKTAAQINALVVPSVPATTNNLAMLDASGDLADSLVESDGAGNIAANVTGDLTGNADTVTTNANLTGDVTSSGNATTITPDIVENSMLISPVAGSTVIKRVVGATTPITTDKESAYDAADIYHDIDYSTHVVGTVLVSGVITVSADHRVTNGTYTAYMRIMKNGVSEDSWSNGTTTYAARTVDITVTVGDVIVVQQYVSNNVTNSQIRNVLVTSDSANMAIS